MKVGFVSLGCSKNLVDTEMMIGIFKKNNYEIVAKPEEAQIIVINTCGFIESAKQEGINTILEMVQYKQTGKCEFIIVTGCLVQRYKEELEKLIPEVDLFLKIDEYENIALEISKLIKNEKIQCERLDYLNRVITTGKDMAYLKIAEGCSNKCTYCAIPKIRGKYISRKIEDVITEAEQLVKKGVREIIVIAQDTTKYGIDLYGESKLAELLQELATIKELKWIRFLYAYPESITEELIDTVKNNEKICNYFDIPIQHISNSVLKRMNRKSNKESIEKLIKSIRAKIPDVTIRTTVMVGFPGETEEDFNELYQFIKETKFDKMGTFMYSKEDDTPAYKLKEQIHPMTKKKRFNKIMKLQQEISKNNLESKIGNTYEAKIEDLTHDGKYYIARTSMDVPDMDGVVFIKNTKELKQGDFINCKIIGTVEYDLIGEIQLITR